MITLASSPRFRLMIGIGLVLLLSGQAFAWGAAGHRLIGRVAVAALPPELPTFLRSPVAVDAVGELAREPDRWKDAGRLHDSERDTAHFLSLSDDGRVLGGPSLLALPTTRQDYDAALRAVGADSWKAGWLPYAIIDGWQQLTKDLAYWRVDAAAGANVADPMHRAWFVADRTRREALILRDLGTLAHYVGDASQPMHVSVHFNGWGNFPNPEGFTQTRFHAAFEGAFVHTFVTQADVAAAMAPYTGCQCPIVQRTGAYLAATNAEIAPLFRLQKADGFVGGDVRGRAFVTNRLAAGAAQLRDMSIEAWWASENTAVGWPSVKVVDVEAGRIDPWESLYGSD